MNKCECGSNAFWKCQECDAWCCHAHIDYVIIILQKNGISKKGAWLCPKCKQKYQKGENQHATTCKVDSCK